MASCDLEAVTAAHAGALGRRRIAPVGRSAPDRVGGRLFADADASRSSEPIEALIPALLARLSPGKARKAKQVLRLVDATLIRPGYRADWACFQTGTVAAKVHVVFDPSLGVPVFVEVTSGNTEPALWPAS